MHSTITPTYERIADKKRLDFIIDNINYHLSNHGEILDVGCGNGIISINLGRYGYMVWGIDTSDVAISKARVLNTYSNVNFEAVSIEDFLLEGKTFDAIICSEVLEHLHHPNVLIRKILKGLKPSGILIVTVPNGQGPREFLVTRPIQFLSKKKSIIKIISSIKKILGYKGTTIQSDAENLTHLQFFTRKKLLKLAVEERFKIIKFGHSNFIDDVFPVSFFANRIIAFQKMDCKFADYLPHKLVGGYFMVCKKDL